MRQFPKIIRSLGQTGKDDIEMSLRRLQRVNKSLSQGLEVGSCLKPEVSIMLELYQAKRSGQRMTVTMLGLLDAIAPTTTLRYLAMLEESGAIQRRAHESDGRVTYVEISDAAKAAIDHALESAEAT